MSSLIATIKLREVATNQAIQAQVFDGIDQTHLSNWKTKWVPVVQATEARLLALGAPASAYPQSAHWDWNKKTAAFQNLLSYRMFAVTCAQDTQGLMAVATDVVMHPSRFEPVRRRRIFREWRQSSNAIAVRSTNALKQSSWYRTSVTHPVRSAGLR
jgi:hypothetical protein